MSVGNTLREARLARNLSIAEVATAIRVRATIVQEIEADLFDSCGGEVYGRGHQRSYARYLGLDIEDQIVTVHIPEKELETASLSPTKLSPLGARPNWSMVLGSGTLVAVALVAVIIVGNNPGVSKSELVTSPTPTQENVTNDQSVPTETDTTSPGDLTAAATSNVSFSVKVVSDSCWLRVADASGELIFQGVLRVGDQREFSDSTQLAIVLGNAGGVNLTLNGIDIGVPGARGEVLRRTLVPGQTDINS